MHTRNWTAAVLLAAGLSVFACADEISELRKEVERQYNALLKMQTKLLEIEAAQQEQAKQVKKMESSVGSLKWAEKISFYGDFRYRHEQIDGDNIDRRDRHRIRARLGLKGKVADEWLFDLRLAAGSADPVSTNQDLTDGFTSKGFWLDQAYLTYKPKAIEGLSVLAGKMAMPFYTAGKNQLIWDSDLTPEGIAAKYTAALSETLTAFGNVGGMWVKEEGKTKSGVDYNDDIGLFGFQGGMTHLFENKSSLTGGLSFYKYSNIKGQRTIYYYDSDSTKYSTKSFGNTTYADGTKRRYLYGYDLLEAFGEYNMLLHETPVAFYGSYVLNTASGVKDDTGWLVGATYNKASEPNSWEISYDYRDLERDAVLGAFTDSDFIGGGTNGKGHRFGFKYALAKNVTAGASYYLNKRDNDSDLGDGKRDDSYKRFQVDVELKF